MRRATWKAAGKRSDSTSAAAGNTVATAERRESRKQARPDSFRMTEHELLRIIAFLERVRLPFQELVPIAEEDATWNMLLFLSSAI